MPNRSAKHWCWTLNNYTEHDVQRIDSLAGNEEIQYLIYGKETGQNNTPHLQGFISFKKRTSFKKAKGFISQACHIEPAKGSPLQNKTYCSKDGDFQEFGELPRGQGARNDLVKVAAMCEAGDSLQSIAQEYPGAALRYSTGIIRLKHVFSKPRQSPPELWCLWGKTGTGKTRRIWEFADVDMLWVHPGDRWFDGYDGHPAVLFDDFDGGWFKITYLLKIIDRYPFTVPVKGAYVNWAPKVIYFTSNHHPKEWYTQAKQEHQEALLRRFREFGHIQECKHY